MEEILTEQRRLLLILEYTPTTDQARRSARCAYLDQLSCERLAIRTRLGGCPLLLHCCAAAPPCRCGSGPVAPAATDDRGCLLVPA